MRHFCSWWLRRLCRRTRKVYRRSAKISLAMCAESLVLAPWRRLSITLARAGAPSPTFAADSLVVLLCSCSHPVLFANQHSCSCIFSILTGEWNAKQFSWPCRAPRMALAPAVAIAGADSSSCKLQLHSSCRGARPDASLPFSAAAIRSAAPRCSRGLQASTTMPRAGSMPGLACAGCASPSAARGAPAPSLLAPSMP